MPDRPTDRREDALDWLNTHRFVLAISAAVVVALIVAVVTISRTGTEQAGPPATVPVTTTTGPRLDGCQAARKDVQIFWQTNPTPAAGRVNDKFAELWAEVTEACPAGVVRSLASSREGSAWRELTRSGAAGTVR